MAQSDPGDLPRLPASYVRALAGWRRSPTAATRVPELAATARWEVDPSRLVAFRSVVGSAAEVPVTFPAVPLMALTMELVTRRSFPVRAIGLVHRASSIRVTDGVDAGQPWDLRAWTAEGRNVRSGLEFDVHTQVSISGRVRWTSRDVYLARSRSASGAAPSAVPGLDRDGPWSAEAVLRADQGVARAFARVTGDVNPIHLHALGGRAFGFPAAIAHGWWTAGRCAALLGPDEAIPGREYDIEFVRPLLLPSTPVLRSRAGGEFVLEQRDRGREPGTVLVAGRLRG